MEKKTNAKKGTKELYNSFTGTVLLWPCSQRLCSLHKREQSQSKTKFAFNKGIASLPAMLLFGGIIIEIAIASAFLVFYLNNTIYGTRLGNEALAAAQAGIDDGILQVILDKDCPNAACSASYSIDVDNRSVDVTICKDTCQGSNTHEITALGKALTRRHKIVAILSTDPYTGLVSIDSIQEEEL
ncbi:MAG: hypothetical protein Q8Q32_00650 [bacterium]|nr:hypothetical protein [bacterium]